MTVNGHVENGMIVLDESVRLTDGMKVRVELINVGAIDANSPKRKNTDPAATFYERHKAWIGSITDAPADYARNHDHYLHGHEKQ
jgi:hypothetical protein